MKRPLGHCGITATQKADFSTQNHLTMKRLIFKHKFSSFLFILTSMSFLFLLPSCENSDPQVKADTGLPVEPRSIDDCEDCPVDYCCCAVEIVDPIDNYWLQFCGVYTNMAGSPCGPFSPGSPCGTISGSSSTLQLSSSNTRALFCVPTGGSFRILKTLGGDVTLRISCDLDQVAPTWFPFNLGSDPVYYHVEDCDDLEGC
jgi:hypothetical protein